MKLSSDSIFGVEKKKLRLFKSEFLGYAPNAKKCKISNEKDIILVYNSALNTLTAYSDKPIIIKNYYLGYEIRYNLVDFEIIFITPPSGFRMTEKVYYAGTSFFTELKKKTRTKTINNREKEYDGSLIHFMRSLSTKQLTENKFAIYFESFPTNPYRYFNITKENNQTRIEMTTNKLSILYNMFDQSSIQPFTEDIAVFYVDKTGNHSPPNSLLFGGVFGQKRMMNMLPLDYNPITK